MGIRRKKNSDESSRLLGDNGASRKEMMKQRCFPLKKGEHMYDKYIRPLVAEFFGTLFLVYLGCMSSLTGSLIITAMGHGLTLFFVVIVFGKVSGGHVNPAVSLGVALSGNLGAIQTFFYILAQLVGAITGAGLVVLTTDDADYLAINGGVPTLGAGVDILHAVFVETMVTFILVLAILMTAVDSKSPLAPLAIGLALVVLILAGSVQTGGAVNPARALGPAVIFSKEGTDHWEDHWVYWVGPILGALLAAVIFRFLLASPSKRAVCHDDAMPSSEEEEHNASLAEKGAKVMGGE